MLAILRDLLLVLTFSSLCSAQTCYFPDGSLHGKGSPCYPTSATSACCEGTHTCMNNGVCWDTENNHIIRGSCTDQSWESTSCPTLCKSSPSNANADIRQCNDQNNNWVCSRDPSDCSNSFEVPWGFVDDHRTGNLSNVLYPPQPSSTSSNSSQTSAAATNSLSAAPASAPTASGPANFDTSSCPTTNLSWREAAIGAGVGVPLAVALAISLALLVREKRVSKRAQIPSSSPGLAIPLQNAKNTRDYYHELGPDPTHAAVEVEGSGVRPSAYSRNQNKGAYIAE